MDRNWSDLSENSYKVDKIIAFDNNKEPIKLTRKAKLYSQDHARSFGE